MSSYLRVLSVLWKYFFLISLVLMILFVYWIDWSCTLKHLPLLMRWFMLIYFITVLKNDNWKVLLIWSTSKNLVLSLKQISPHYYFPFCNQCHLHSFMPPPRPLKLLKVSKSRVMSFKAEPEDLACYCRI